MVAPEGFAEGEIVAVTASCLGAGMYLGSSIAWITASLTLSFLSSMIFSGVRSYDRLFLCSRARLTSSEMPDCDIETIWSVVTSAPEEAVCDCAAVAQPSTTSRAAERWYVFIGVSFFPADPLKF